jgi:hypothetical protein
MKRWMLLGLLACACGSSNDGNGGTPDSGTPHGTGSFSGTVNGHALTVNDAVFGNPNSGFMAIIASDRSDLCTLLGGTTFPGGTVTVLGVAVANLTLPPTNIVTGAYAWYPLQGHVPPSPGLYFDGAFALPTDCTGGGEAFVPTGGTVTVTQLGTTSGTHLKATYSNLTFAPADGGTADVGTLSGSVDAVYCPNAVANPSCGKLLLARPPSVE